MYKYRRFRAISAKSACAGAVTVALWGATATAALLAVDWRFVVLGASAAITHTVLAGAAILLRRSIRDPVVRRLADTVVASQRAALTVTTPLRAVR